MMASNDDERNRPLTGGGAALSRYDLVLAVIPAAFLLAGIASQVLSVAPRATLVGATLVGALALLDGLFVNPPRSGSRPR